MKNRRIREAAKNAGVWLWEIAEHERVSEYTFYRRLRRELSEADTKRILDIIAQIAQGRKEGTR